MSKHQRRRAKRQRAKAQQVLLEMSKIPTDTLRSWLTRHFSTVSGIAIAELGRRREAP